MLILERNKFLARLLGLDPNGQKSKINKLRAIGMLVLMIAFILMSVGIVINNIHDLVLVTKSIKDFCSFLIPFTYFAHYWINFSQFDLLLIEMQCIVNESKCDLVFSFFS